MHCCIAAVEQLFCPLLEMKLMLKTSMNCVKGFLVGLLLLVTQLITAQCVFVSITGPKCAGGGMISGTFSRSPYQIEWLLNDSVLQKTRATLSTVPTTVVSGSTGGRQRVSGTHGIAIDNSGNIYVSDTLNNRVVAYSRTTPDGVTVAGGTGNGNAPNQLNKPAGLFIDGFGNLFVTDQYNNRVLRFAPGSSNGFLVAGGNGKGAGANQLSDPRDVYVDRQGFVYIADAGNHRIQRWAQGGASGITVAGGRGPGSDSLRLNSPQGVAVDQNFNIYVADSANNRVQKFKLGNLSGKTVMGQLGKGTGYGYMFQPVDVLVNAFDEVFVVEAGNSRVQKLFNNEIGMITIAGSDNGIAGSDNSQFNYPSGIAFDVSGNLFVLDQQNGRVQQYGIIPINTEFRPYQGGVYIARVNSFSGCVQQSNAIFVNPNPEINIIGKTAICTGDVTELKLLGSNNYTWFPNTGVTRTNDSTYLVKPDSTTFYGITSTTDSGCISYRPLTISVGLRSIPVVTPTICLSPDATKVTTTILGERPASLNYFRGGGIKAGSFFPEWGKTGTVFAGGNGIGNGQSQFGLPMGTFVDPKGNVYVADAVNHRIQLWKPGDLVGTTVVGGKGEGNGNDQLNYPTGVFVDAVGNIYVADQNNHRIQYFPRGSTVATTVAGGLGLGNGTYQLNFPSSVFVDSYGNIYIADAGNHRVQKWSNGGASVKTVAGTGLPGNDNVRLNNPQAVFVDQKNNLFVADAENHRIMFYDQTTIVGFVAAGNRGPGTLPNQLNFPAGIFVDGNSNMFIADRGNNRIHRWALFDTVGTTVAGLANGSSGSALDQLQLPNALGIDLKGNMYVADSRNYRIQRYTITAGADTVLQTRISGNYTALSASFSGCVTGSGTAFVVVAPDLKIKTDTTNICEGGQARLIVSGSNNYRWSPSAGLSVTNRDTVLARPSVTTKYTVVSSIGNGCNSSAEVVVTVYKRPVMSIVSPTCISTEPMVLNANPKVRSLLWTRNNDSISRTTTTYKDLAETVAGKLNGGTDSTQFGRPSFVFVDAFKNIYVCDQWNHRVQKWVPGAKAGITVAGGKGVGNRLSQLNNPNSIYVTTDGFIYVADTDNDRIMLWKEGDTTGTIVAGGNGRGVKPNQLSSPSGVFVDAYGAIYIADALNARIQQWVRGGIAGKTVAGGNFAGAAANQLSIPLGVFVDQFDNIYIADSQNDRIQRWKLGETRGTTVAGGRGKGNNANQVVTPLNIFVDANNQMLITEGGTANRIKRWRIGVDSGIVVAGGTIKGSGPDQLDAPGNGFIDVDGDFYVSDMNNFRVQRFSSADTSFTIFPKTRGTYNAIATSFAGCVARSDNFILDSGFIPTKPIVSDIQYCLNEPARPLAAYGDSLLWHTGANGGVGSTTAPLPVTNVVNTSTYWVSRINTISGCQSIRQKITVSVKPLPGASLAFLGKQNILPGDTAKLVASADSGKVVTKILWYRNGSLITSIPDTTDQLYVFYATTGRYNVAITDTNFCTSVSDSVDIRADLTAAQQIYFFPNPVVNNAKIIFTPLTNSSTFVKVISNGGVVMINQRVNTFNTTGNFTYDLDLRQLPKGIYNLELVTGAGRIIARNRFVKL